MRNTGINISAIRSILLMFVCCMCISLAAQTDTTKQVISLQTENNIDFRVPDKSKIEEFNKDKRFDYNQPSKGKISAWDRFRYWLYDSLNDIINTVSDLGIPGVVLIVFIALLIAFIIMKFIGVDYKKVLGKKKIDTPEIDIYTENVHEMDFDTLITNAMKNRDYRLVIRFLYLKSLKSLSDKEIIRWEPNKTNYSYQHEISDSGLRSKFLEATLIFDYIWYGEFTVNEQQFSDIYSRMNDLNRMITSER